MTDLQLALADNQGVVCLNNAHGTSNHLINDLPRALPLVHNSSGLTHKERSCVIHGVIIDIISKTLHVPFDWNCSLACELLDLVLAVLFPVSNVWVVANAERSASEDDGADVIVEACGSDGFLVGLWCAGFLYSRRGLISFRIIS